MNKQQWQQELGQLKLSHTKKQRMIEQIQSAKPKSRGNWGYRLVLPSFVILAVLFTLLTLQPANVIDLVSGTTTTVEADHQKFITKTFYWFGGGLIVGVLFFVQAIAILLKTVRWDNSPRVQRIRAYLQGDKGQVTRLFSFVLLALLLLLPLVVTLYVPNPILLLQVYICFFIYANLVASQLWDLRESRGVVCPTCGHHFTRKEVRKKTTNAYKETCDKCDGPLYVKKMNRTNAVKAVILPCVIIGLPQMGMPFLLVVSTAVIYISIIIYYIAPLMTEFTTEDEPLW